MSFAEVREYQYGDDIRNIDWNVTARAGAPFVKVFEEERELTVVLLVDVSGSGDFGSGGRMKEEVAAEICAILAFSAIRNNDKVGLDPVQRPHREVRPAAQGPAARAAGAARAAAIRAGGRAGHRRRRRAGVSRPGGLAPRRRVRRLRLPGRPGTSRRWPSRAGGTIWSPSGSETGGSRSCPPSASSTSRTRSPARALTVNLSDRAFREAFAADARAAEEVRTQLFRRTGVDVVEVAADRPSVHRAADAVLPGTGEAVPMKPIPAAAALLLALLLPFMGAPVPPMAGQSVPPAVSAVLGAGADGGRETGRGSPSRWSTTRLASVAWPEPENARGRSRCSSSRVDEPRVEGGRAVSSAELVLTAFELGELEVPAFGVDGDRRGREPGDARDRAVAGHGCERRVGRERRHSRHQGTARHSAECPDPAAVAGRGQCCWRGWGYWLWRRSRRGAPDGTLAPAAPPRPAHEIAYEAFRILEAERAAGPGRDQDVPHPGVGYRS